MNRSRPAWLPMLHGKGRLSREPGAAIFQGLRVRLTLWYCAVLGAALVLFGVFLYLGVQYLLLSPVEANLSKHAQFHTGQLAVSPYDACSSTTFAPQPGSPDQPSSSSGQAPMSELVACYDQNATLLPAGNTTKLPNAFLSNTLAKAALQQGTVTDIVDGGGTIGPIYRYAILVSSPDGGVRIMQFGTYVNVQESALSALLTLLLTIGGLALVGAGVGGLFLANRALAPARLAWANQQRFIADASHELRTPLTLLRADAEVLLRGREQLAMEDAALLEDIVAEANHMSILATNMLTLARLDNSSSHQEHEVVNLIDVVHAGVRRVQALADQTEISVQVESNDPALVIGDPALLEQAVLALLDNAIKYNRRGGHVVVRTAIKQGQALLEVSDTGIGIAAEHLPHLGERFYRVDKARSREAGGTGLGLSIAQGIADAHGGTLTLTSIPEQGTTVIITLPQVHGAAPDRINDAPGSVLSLPERKG
jgi:signal transduction histidine kinase